MPDALDTGDRKLLIGAGVVLTILIVASTYLSPKQSAGRAAYPSSYSAEWDGAKAPYLLLQGLHYHVERWEQSPTEIGRNAEQRSFDSRRTHPDTVGGRESPPSSSSYNKVGALLPAARAPANFCPMLRRRRKAI